jgi:hypothetical protein
MVDITKIQLSPIPPAIADLQIANTGLQNKNKELKNVLIVLAACGILYLIHKVLTSIEEENANENE